MIEIARDDWERHWEKYAAAAEVNPAQAYRRELILNALADIGRSRVLDVGSGQGDLLSDLARRWPEAELLGIEMSRSGIREATAKVPSARFWQQNLLQPCSENCPYNGWAQIAVCAEVLEHLDDPARFLRNLTAFLAPDCTVVVTVPGGPISAFDRHIGHRRHYRPHELADVLRRCGFEVESAYGAGFPFFNLYRLAVMLRGSKLIEDAAGGTAGTAPARLLAAAFRGSFRANLTRGKFGWQSIATARWPGR